MRVPDVNGPLDRSALIFASLIGPRLADKYRAIETLNDATATFDRQLLRSLISNALQKEFSAERQKMTNDPAIAQTRSWLAGALGRISPGDQEATQQAIDCVIKNTEPNPWVRYRALEGMIVGRSEKARDVAKAVVETYENSLIFALASVYLASLGDAERESWARKAVLHLEQHHFILGPLRVVPLPFAVKGLCDLVDRAEYSDATYDAIIALGRISSGSLQAGDAANSLSRTISRMRGTPWQDGMRTAAITGLGNLKVESTGPLLLDELTDDNAAIVREAARAMEKILGLETAVDRIVETAIKDPAAVGALAQALRWMNRDAVAGVLEGLMGSGSIVQQEMARTLLSEIGGAVAYVKLRARTSAMQHYGQVLEQAEDRVRDLFDSTVHEAQRGFQIATRMDVSVFMVGMLLILASGTAALLKTGDIATWAGVGGAGVLGTLYSLLISNPRKEVRDAVDHLMTVKIIFLAYLRRLHQTDQAYTRLLLENDRISVDELKEYSSIIGTIMEGTAQQLAAADAGKSESSSRAAKAEHAMP